MDSRIDRYIDGELSEEERETFENEAAADAEIRRELERAVLVKRALGNVPSWECPPEVEDAVLQSVAREPEFARRPTVAGQPKSTRHFRSDRLPARRRRALVPALGVFLLITGIALFVMPRLETPSETYTTAEVEQALLEVQYALGIVGRAGATTAGSVREEVFQANTMDHLRIAIRRALFSDNHTNQ